MQVKIQALSFSPNEQFLASLGGPDDNSLVSSSGVRGAGGGGCMMPGVAAAGCCRRVFVPSACPAPLPARPFASQVLWDVASGQPLCGTPTGSTFTLAMRFFSAASDKIVTAGNSNFTVWT